MAIATAVTPVAATPDSGDGSGTMKIVIISLALLAVGGLGFYFYTTKKTTAKPAAKGGSKGGSTTTTSSSSSSQSSSSSSDEAVDENGDTAEQRAYDAAHYGTQSTSSSGVSPVRTDFDTVYNYQKQNGVWFTATKANPTKWVSLADPKWAAAVAKLNAKYPND